MSEELKEVFAKLLQSQQQFMERVLSDQKELISACSNAASNASSFPLNIPPFQSYEDNMNWEVYLQQLEQHFAAYGVTGDIQKRAYFLSWLGINTYELLQKLYGSAKLSEQAYSELTDKLSIHFKTKVHVSTARYDFFKCRMKTNQCYSEWVADLRGLSRKCQFV